MNKFKFWIKNIKIVCVERKGMAILKKYCFIIMGVIIYSFIFTAFWLLIEDLLN